MSFTIDNTRTSGHQLATEKQLNFILKLIDERYPEGLERDARVKTVASLYSDDAVSRRQASQYIDQLVAMPRAARTTTAPKAAELEDGIYLVNDRIIKVIHAVHGSGNQYGKLLDVETGTWDYAPGIIKTIAADDKLTLQKAKEFGQLYGMCMVCGRTLTDEVSIAAGIGPVCAGRL